MISPGQTLTRRAPRQPPLRVQVLDLPAGGGARVRILYPPTSPRLRVWLVATSRLARFRADSGGEQLGDPLVLYPRPATRAELRELARDLDLVHGCGKSCSACRGLVRR